MHISVPSATQLMLTGVPLGLMNARIVYLATIKAYGDQHWPYEGWLSWRLENNRTHQVLTVAVSLGALLPAILRHGVGGTISMLADTHSFMGWTLMILLAFHLTAPFIVAICLVIGRRRRIRNFGYA